MKYINRDKDNYSIVSDLTEFEDNYEDSEDSEDCNFSNCFRLNRWTAKLFHILYLKTF